jgi:hypothetical protein
VCSLCSIRANAAVFASVRISDPVHLLICYGRRLKLVAIRPALLNHIAGRDRLRIRSCQDSRQTGNYPETGLEEINGDFLEDFGPVEGCTFGVKMVFLRKRITSVLRVMRPESMPNAETTSYEPTSRD